MQFQISTPQSFREDVAKQEARRASKRKFGYGSDMEPAGKKQKQFDFSVPPAPAQSHAATYLRPIAESPRLVEASLPSAQAQIHDMTNFGLNTKKRKKDEHPSVTPAQSHEMKNHGQAMKEPQLDRSSMPPAQAQDTTDPGPAAKKQRLSYANLPPARVRVKMSDEESTRFYAGLYRRRLAGWCKSQGFDYGLFDQNIIPDTLLLSPDFDPYRYMEFLSANNHYDSSGPTALDVSRFVKQSAEDLMANSPELAAYCASKQKPHNFSSHPPNAGTPAQAQSVCGEGSVHHPLDQSKTSRGCPGSGDEISHSPSIQDNTAVSSSAFGQKVNEVCPPLGEKTSTPLSSITSSLESPFRSSSDFNAGCNPKSINLDQHASVGSECHTGNHTVAANSDQTALLSLDGDLRDETTRASSSQTPSVDPTPNKGGRPRGRKPRPPRKPKGPTRFQKNHPVKSTVNIDVWENILVYCPLEFLLKARSISTTFKSVLKDDSFIWKRARLNQFGPDMPDPPLGLSEPHFADLVTGTGCQTRGCTSKKTRKTYWALGKRTCVGCFQTSFIPVSVLNLIIRIFSIRYADVHLAPST